MDSRRRAIRGAIMGVALVAGCAGFVAATRPTPSPTGEVMELLVTTDTGADLRFMPDMLTAPPGTAVRVTFRNASTQSHNLTFEGPIATGTRTIVDPGATDSIDLVTPVSGRYRFTCTIHLGMSGTLTVE